jgi:NAD-dependent SIR2 family protein deacetylase
MVRITCIKLLVLSILLSKVHMKIHGNKEFKCEECGAEFHRKKNLNVHLLRHSGERPHLCETCGKSYRWVFLLASYVLHVYVCVLLHATLLSWWLGLGYFTKTTCTCLFIWELVGASVRLLHPRTWFKPRVANCFTFWQKMHVKCLSHGEKLHNLTT